MITGSPILIPTPRPLRRGALGALEDSIDHGRIAAVTAQGLTEMRGGLPIVADGEVIGAIGANFDTPEDDVQIGQARLVAVPR